MNDAAARPDDSFPVAPHVPRKTHARREIVAIGVVEAWDLNPFLDESQVRIKAAEDVVTIMDNAAELVAQSEVQSKSRANAPVILKEE